MDTGVERADTASGGTRPGWLHNEDWMAVVVGAAVLAAVAAGWKVRLPALAWSGWADLAAVVAPANLAAILATSLAMLGLAVAALGVAAGRRSLPLAAGVAVVLVLAWLALGLAANARVKAFGIEYVVFALAAGLLWRQFLPVPPWLAAAIRTEFFIKVGIVILGAGILFPELLKAGLPGLVQAALVIPVVWQITFLLGRWLGVDDEFGVMVSSAVSICGVSAAIAACGAIQGDKRKLSYVTSLVLLCAVPMMLLMPWCARLLGLAEPVAGAWLGGTLDTTGSVLAATEMLGETASKTGAVVKLSQNVFIGFAALAISVWWTMRRSPQAGGGTRAGQLWARFPKFVLGFIAASLVFSFLLDPKVAKDLDKPLKGLREVWFAAAFVCIGLETRFDDILTLGRGRPALAFLGGQGVNILWTLLLAALLFGGGLR
jgi:uncharacterized membrane protein YadS